MVHDPHEMDGSIAAPLRYSQWVPQAFRGYESEVLGCLHAAGPARTAGIVQGHKTSMAREEEALLVHQKYDIRLRLRVRVDDAVVDSHTVLHRVIVGQSLRRLEGREASGSSCFPDKGMLGL